MNEIPDKLSFEWNEFALSKFVPEELIDGKPTVAGLRRVAELLLGPIIKSGPVQVFPVAGNGVGRATVQYEVHFRWGGLKDDIRIFGEVADVWLGNTDAMFVGYAVATASTRAEARCLRKALKLRTCSAEEITKQDVAKAVSEGSAESITTDQVSFIDMKCKKLDINVLSLVGGGIYDLTKDKAAKIIKDLTTWTNKKELINKDILGYENWR